MTDRRRLDELLRAQDGDAGCSAGEEILDAYVELELAGEDPARTCPGMAIHLQSLSRLPGRSRGATRGGAPLRPRQARLGRGLSPRIGSQ